MSYELVTAELARHLELNGHGTVATNIFADAMPASPDACVGLVSYDSGEPPMRVQGEPTLATEIYHIQVLCRSTSKAAAHQVAREVMETLALICNREIEGNTYLESYPLQMPFLLREESPDGLPVYAFNLRVLRNT